jgi:hypothetical protein
MPIRLRLQRLLIILAGLLFTTVAVAANTLPGESPAADTSKPYPFDNQSVPPAAVTSTARPTAEVVESKPEARQLGNNQCTNGEHNAFQKTLLLTAFARANPVSSSAGGLQDVEHQLPQLLGEQLVDKHTALAPVQLMQSLPNPAISNDSLLAQQIQKLAREQRTQLVLMGDVLDMSMAHPAATYNPGLYTRFINGVFDSVGIKNRFDKRDRIFSFQVNLRDGFTGQTLFSKRYDTFGVRGLKQTVGFGTPLFWQSDYGKQIKGLLKLASKEVGQVIQCQPYIAQIDSRAGQTQILLQGGANNGLRTGDTLALYQMVVQGSETEYERHQVRLVNRNAAIELREVFPSHSVGVVTGTTYLTGQFLAIAP